MTDDGKYRIDVFYKTKRGGVRLGDYVEAFSPEEAEDIARDKHIKPFPARKLVKIVVSRGNRSMESYAL